MTDPDKPIPYTLTPVAEAYLFARDARARKARAESTGLKWQAPAVVEVRKV